jgi:hypothetical protein
MLKFVFYISFATFLNIFEILILSFFLKSIFEKYLFKIFITTVVYGSFSFLVFLQSTVNGKKILDNVLIASFSCKVQSCISILINDVAINFIAIKGLLLINIIL